MNAIEIEDLCKSYTVGFRMKKVAAVKGLSLTIPEGEVFGIIGPNGAGKTTTLKMLMGLTWPTSGAIRIFGKDAREVAPRSQIGFLPERPYFYQYLTAREFLNFYGQLYNLPEDVRRERTERLLARVEMTASADTPLHKFSKGMLQRVGMAQALIADPRLVVLDEPMSGLDPLGRMMIRDIILELKAEGRTILFSSHILSDVEVICDRIGILAGGKLGEVGTVDELLRQRVKATEFTAIGRADDLPPEVRALADQIAETRDRVLITVADEAKKVEIAQRLFASGLPVVSMTPRHDTLEDIFVARLGKASGRSAQGGV